MQPPLDTLACMREKLDHIAEFGGGLAREAIKWAVATWRSVTKTQSGVLLWTLTALLVVVVYGSARVYQDAQLELAVMAALPAADLQGAVATASSPADGQRLITGKHPRHSQSIRHSRFYRRSLEALALLTVSGSLLAALMVSILQRIKLRVTEIDQSKALTLLLTGNADFHLHTRTQIKIVVPQYTYSQLLVTASSQKNLRDMYVKFGGHTRKFAKDRSVDAVNMRDSQAAELILSRLRAVGFENVEVVRDEDLLAGRAPRAPLEILVGLNANALVEELMEKEPPALFRTTWIGAPADYAPPPQTDELNYEIRLAETARDSSPQPPDSNHAYKDDVLEAMLIAKVRRKDSRTQLIVGGVSELASLRCAEYFCEHIQSIPDTLDHSSRRRVGGNPFALVLRCQKGSRNGDLTIAACRV